MFQSEYFFVGLGAKWVKTALKSSCCLYVFGIWDLRCLAFVYMLCWLFAVLVVGCPLPVPRWMLQKRLRDKGLKGVRWESCVFCSSSAGAPQKCSICNMKHMMISETSKGPSWGSTLNLRSLELCWVASTCCTGCLLSRCLCGVVRSRTPIGHGVVLWHHFLDHPMLHHPVTQYRWKVKVELRQAFNLWLWCDPSENWHNGQFFTTQHTMY